MRNVIANLFVSLDGFTTGRDGDVTWITDQFGDEQAQYELDQHLAVDTLLLGRVTYQIMAAYWPSTAPDSNAEPWKQTGQEWSFAARLTERMNHIPKLVFSNTLGNDDVTWSNTRLHRGDAAAGIIRLKQQPGRDIGIRGSASLVRSLVRAGLVDRIRLEVLPVVLGAHGGKPVFFGYPHTALELVGSTTLDSRVVVLDYRPTVSAAA